MTVREPIGAKAKKRVLALEGAARELEARAAELPRTKPEEAYAMQAVAQVFRLKALYMRQVPGIVLTRRTEDAMQLAKREFGVSVVD
jgi:hypothetical protein